MALQRIAGAPVGYLDFTVNTTNNSYVSPFSAYGEITPSLPTGARPISATIIDAGSTNSSSLVYRMQMGSPSLSVWSHTAAAIKVRIVYYIP